MEYVALKSAPQRLLDNQVQWTLPWVNYYKKIKNENGDLLQSNKPRDSHWCDNDIRRVLIASFYNNCGYCGCSRPTPSGVASNTERAPRGHVDHYRAKAIHPKLTYEWSNYIWSCEACNLEKGEFDDPQYPILNPCNKQDCEQLNYIEDNGAYVSNTECEECLRRFKHTENNTMINASEFQVRRRNRINSLRRAFEGIHRFLCVQPNEVIQEQIQAHKKSIIESREDPEFYFLMLRIYSALCLQYPKAAEALRDSLP